MPVLLLSLRDHTGKFLDDPENFFLASAGLRRGFFQRLAAYLETGFIAADLIFNDLNHRTALAIRLVGHARRACDIHA